MNRRSARLSMLCLLLAACGGPGDPSDAGAGCAGEADGAGCTTAGGAAGICLSEACVESRCGDGYVDEAAGEQCEDGNEVAFDGCDPDACTFSCDSDAACDDLNPCNGEGICNSMHVCVATAPLQPGDVCSSEAVPDGICRAGDTLVCVPAGVCGNGVHEEPEVCDDGNADDTDGCTAACAYTCVDDAGCGDDGDACNGIERCDQVTHVCRTDTPPMPSWYIDCDLDGFALDTTGAVESCTRPTTPPSQCTGGGQWVALRPASHATTDCNDENAEMRPGQTAFFTSETDASFDYNCDGDEEMSRTAGSVSRTAECRIACSLCLCSGPSGWTNAPPACGASAEYSYCDQRIGTGCQRFFETETQACR